jgi:hypothetical protein
MGVKIVQIDHQKKNAERCDNKGSQNDPLK